MTLNWRILVAVALLLTSAVAYLFVSSMPFWPRGRSWSPFTDGEVPSYFLLVGKVEPITDRLILFSWEEYESQRVRLADRDKTFSFKSIHQIDYAHLYI